MNYQKRLLAAADGTGAGAGASGATSDTGAAGGTGSATPPATTNTSTPDWTTGFNDDLKGYIGNKGFKGASDLAESYRGLEKLRGVPQERLLTLPERFYDEAGKLTVEGRAVREKIGAPKDAKDYNLASPKEGGDPKLLEHFRSVFHELGLPKADAEKITGSWNAYAEAQGAAVKEQALATFKDQQASLSKEWGMATEQNTTLAKDAVRAMGIKDTQLNALAAIIGHAETMKFFHKLGTQVREAPFIGGQRSDTVLEPINAKNQIKELLSDKDFGKRLEAGDKDAKFKWENLHKQAYPGQMNI